MAFPANSDGWGQQLKVLLWARHKPLQVVRWLSGERGTISTDVQQVVLTTLRTDPLLSIGAPLEPGYLQQLLKHLIDAAEAEHVELEDDLIELYTTHLLHQASCSSSSSSGGWLTKTFTYAPYGVQFPSTGALRQHVAWAQAAKNAQPGLPETVKDAVQGNLLQGGQGGLLTVRASSNVLQGGTGCAEWEAGLVLAEVLMSHPAMVEGRRCIELGCGCGAVGITATRAGAAHVLLTDGNVDAVNNCRLNCALNGVDAAAWDPGQPALSTKADRAACGVLEWERAAHFLPAWANHIDVVLGSDLLYDPAAIPHLMHLMELLLCPGVADAAPVAFLATTRRNEATLALFLEAVKGHSLLRIVDVTQDVCKCDTGSVRFLHLPWLEEARPRVVIHRITPVT